MELTFKINSLGEAVRYKRSALGLTQRKLGAKLGIDVTYVSKIENDVVTPATRLIRDLEVILELPIGTLFLLAEIPPVQALDLPLDFLDLLDKCIKKYGRESVELRLRNLLGVKNGNAV